MATCLISVGANLGDRRHTIEHSLQRVSKLLSTTLVSRSELYATAAVGGPADQPEFLNAAAIIETSLTPLELLHGLQEIQREAGRVADTRWGPRTLDLDLLLYDAIILHTPELVIPHPRMSFRRFVLEPAVEVAPDMIDPRNGWTVRRLWQHLQQTPNFLAITGLPGVGQTGLARAAAARLGAEAVLQPARLADLHFDSPSRDLSRELEFLRQCLRVLPRRDVVSAEQTWICDFWIEELLVSVEAAGLGSASAAFDEVQAHSQHLLTPKLMVMLEASSERCAHSPALSGFQDRLSQLLSQPDRPPVLKLLAANTAWNLEEIVAAALAMR